MCIELILSCSSSKYHYIILSIKPTNKDCSDSLTLFAMLYQLFNWLSRRYFFKFLLKWDYWSAIILKLFFILKSTSTAQSVYFIPFTKKWMLFVTNKRTSHFFNSSFFKTNPLFQNIHELMIKTFFE